MECWMGTTVGGDRDTSKEALATSPGVIPSTLPPRPYNPRQLFVTLTLGARLGPYGIVSAL